MAAPARHPRRGEIWFFRFHADPPGKGIRPVLIVSSDARNQHPRADSVLGVPLSTSVHRNTVTHVLLPSAETGLSEDSAACAEDITVVLKTSLVEPRSRLRQVSHARICQIGRAIQSAINCMS